MIIHNFILNVLQESIEDIFSQINQYIFGDVDTNHVYIDGIKIKANVENYTWVWKKSCIKNRNKVFGSLTQLLTQVNEVVKIHRCGEFETRQEYSLEYVEYISQTFLKAVGRKQADFVSGSGKRKTLEQKLYEKLAEYRNRLKRYSEHIQICGEKRNSYCKTDHDATFMRVKRTIVNREDRKTRKTNHFIKLEKKIFSNSSGERKLIAECGRK